MFYILYCIDENTVEIFLEEFLSRNNITTKCLNISECLQRIQSSPVLHNYVVK